MYVQRLKREGFIEENMYTNLKVKTCSIKLLHTNGNLHQMISSLVVFIRESTSVISTDLSYESYNFSIELLQHFGYVF